VHACTQEKTDRNDKNVPKKGYPRACAFTFVQLLREGICMHAETCSESLSARVLRLLGRKPSEFFQEGFQSFDLIPYNLK